MRLGLLMRRMALDWTLSRRQRVDFGAPPQTWEQYSKEGRIWDLYIWEVSVMRYFAGIFKWNNNDIQQIDRKTMKVMIVNKEI